MLKGLKKKKEIKTMNSRVAINTYLSTIESKKQTKQRSTETESWIWVVFFDSCQMGGGLGEWVKR